MRVSGELRNCSKSIPVTMSGELTSQSFMTTLIAQLYLVAHKARELAVSFLSYNLGLTINPKNDIIVTSKDGLKFLGHTINKDLAVVDTHTTKSVLGKLSWQNAASYKALSLSGADKKSLDWILLENYFDVSQKYCIISLEFLVIEVRSLEIWQLKA